ncbi:hypothetical protein PIROE2DRAFT_15791 [Piromyces sp. E2]|nr:hypothetical protein PIROE2DRAFT_15791 [Piromyces sp. E2]|eukprot:OUM58841.1 hypothetical protein PIROE2DRAFT_15791 [Piromyces sp. E2]
MDKETLSNTKKEETITTTTTASTTTTTTTIDDTEPNNKNPLKILVLGVGVIGSLMVHYLCEAGNDVTVCARKTYPELKENGLILKHHIQKKTTVDHPKVVKEVDFSEKYDIVFSVMQGQQQLALLDTYSRVHTKLLVLVGNNMEADRCEAFINEHNVSERHILFGFQSSAGHREDGITVVARTPTVSLFIGGLRSPGHPKDLCLVKRAFKVKGYKLIEVANMYAYYLYHVDQIMPLAYLSYKYDCDLKKATSKDITMVMEASKEAIEFLKANNIMPNGEDTYYYGLKGKLMYAFFRVICKNTIGRLMISDHCRNAVDEMKYLDDRFEQYRTQHSKMDMPTWETTRKWAKSAFNLKE